MPTLGTINGETFTTYGWLLCFWVLVIPFQVTFPVSFRVLQGSNLTKMSMVIIYQH